nr:MAG TPA: RNA-dependent RNA polymerase [Caudoviricetes sp.]
MTKNTGVYIPSIDAKDIYLSANYIEKNPDGYNLRLKDGQYNLRKFINTLDYSLDLIELMDIYYKKFRKHDFYFKVKRHKYSANVINMTFKYSVKEWNQMNKNTFVKFGYNYNSLIFDDGVAKDTDGEVIGIKLNEKIINPIELPKPFYQKEVKIYDKKDKSILKEIQVHYVKKGEPKTLKTNAELRKELYMNGFTCNGIEYCRMKRSTGSARVGKCLFIRKELFEPLLAFSSGGLKYKQGDPIDLAAYEGYIALPSSSIIDTIPIKPENILLIDDYDSVFNEDVVETHDEDNWLVTTEKKCEISNTIWDGQSLMDISLFGDYSEYGMVLLRNLMFKSCCFNCNIQQWFKDNNITDVSQLNGKTRAKNIEDVKLITTPNSIKYLKFSTYDEWLDNLYPDFGVVKHDKKTHFFGGRLVQTHYQLINTLQMSKDEVREFLQESLDFAQMLRDKPEVVRYYIKYPDIDELNPLSREMTSKNDVVYNLMCVNDNFTQTKYYKEFLIDLLRSYYKNLKNGHIYVNGNYSTLLGNPIEMLQQSIGKFDGISQIGVGNIHSTRFKYNQTLLASRSPHVTIGNIWLPYNTENKLIDCYFNLTNEIVCINSIDENVLQRLSGADFDSDTVLLTDNEKLIRAAKRNYHLFKTPTALVDSKKVKRYYTPEDQADLDIKTSVNKIGEIVNLSQELNSLLWDKMYQGSTYEEVKDIYYDICQLDVMSGIEIDKAKKEFDINNSKELDKLRQKYVEDLKVYEIDENGNSITRKKMPHFFSHISKQKGFYNPSKKKYCKYNTSMDYLQTVINGFKIKNPYKKDWLPFVSILDNSLFRTSGVNQKQIDKIFNMLKKFVAERKTIYSSDTDSTEDKSERVKKLKEDLIAEIESETIGFSTLYRMLSSLEDKENSQIKNVLLDILWLCGNESFNKAIINSSEEILEIQDDGNDINMFGIGFKIAKKQVNSEI